MSVAHEDHYGPWTMEEVLALGEDRGQRRELMMDAPRMSPAPGTKHRRASVVDAAAAAEDPVTCDAEAVHLVVEIVPPSAGGRRIDRLLKPPYYAEAGIEHLWRLELELEPDPAPDRRPGPGQAGSSARAETPVMRWRAKVRISSAVWSYAVT